MSLADVKTELLLVCFLQTFLPDDTHDSSVILCFVETSAFGCADTGGMTCLGVNCVQGTAGLLPLSSHTHTHSFIQKYSSIHTHTVHRCKGALAKGPTLQMKERKGEERMRPGPVLSPITLQTEMTDRRWMMMDHFAFFSWLESQSRPS